MVQPRGEDIFRPAWSPDGKTIFFVCLQLQATSYPRSIVAHDIESGPEVPTLALWRISVERGEPPKLDIEMNELRDITVHPDGKHISFTAGNPAHAEVWVLENFLPKAEVAQAEQ